MMASVVVRLAGHAEGRRAPGRGGGPLQLGHGRLAHQVAGEEHAGLDLLRLERLDQLVAA